MDYHAWENKLKVYIRNHQVMTALAVAIVAGMVAFCVLFKDPMPGVMDYGEYTQTLYEMGLSYTNRDMEKPEELTFVKVIEEYDVDQIQLKKLLQLEPSQSLIYPVSLVALVCKLTGTVFSTRYLACLLAVTAILCIYSITKSLYFYIKEYAALGGILLTMLVFCGSYAVYFNSLYANGIFLIGLLLYFTVLFSIAAHGGRKGTGEIVRLMLASLILLNSRDTAVFMLPVVVAANLFMIFYCRPKKGKRLLYFVSGFLFLFLLLGANIRFVSQEEEAVVGTRLYHSFYTGVLQNTGEPEALLRELGLPEETVHDIGKNAYLASEEYAVPPGSVEAQEKIFPVLNTSVLFRTLRTHPDIYAGILKEAASYSRIPDTGRFLYEGRRGDEGTEWVERFEWWQWVRRFFAPGNAAAWGAVYLLALAVILAELVIGRRSREKRGLCVLALTGTALSAVQFYFLFACYGFAEAGALGGYVMIPFDFMLAGGLGYLGYRLGRVSSYLAIGKGEVPAEGEEEEAETGIIPAPVVEEVALKEDAGEDMNLESPIKELVVYGWKRFSYAFAETVLDYPSRSAWFYGLAGAILISWILFWPPGIGAYNNGDFGRMMSAMNLQYTEEDWANPEELSLTKVVEEYDWVQAYDYTKIMPYNADLSQAWFSLPIKILDTYIGLQFSTRYLALMYAVITVLCFAVIIKVLFHRFGRRFFVPSLFLIVLLFDLGNTGWFNSLFGEGIAFVGFLMVLASSLYVVDGERGSCRFSLLLLLFSILIYCGSKAQFTVTAPLLLLWAAVLFLYHMPAKLWKRIFYFASFLFGCLWIGVSSVTLYNNNNDISSPDAVYQSIFYGALMISNDPEQTLTELGLDPALAADTGKHAFLDKSEYYCAPRTEEAQEQIYSKVTTMDMLLYYLKHPDKLWTIMDMTAGAAAEPMPDFTLYVGEKTTGDRHTVNRLNLWREIRYLFAADHFLPLVLLYGLEMIVCTGYFLSRKRTVKDKLLMGAFLLMSVMGILQFPLTIIGNGFADNTKQLFLFRLTYDLTLFIGAYMLLPAAWSALRRIGSRLGQKKYPWKGGEA